VLAIGETVCREFGFDGIFYGTINAFRREDDADLYTVRYTDGRGPRRHGSRGI
jgi:hypothetical protein